MVSYNTTSFHSHGNNHHQQPPINQKHQFLSMQKPPSKPSKKPPSSAAQPSASTKPRVYNVKPIHFRELVQRLTGASQCQPQPQPQPPSQRIQSAPPPPIQLVSHLNNAWAAPSEAYASNTHIVTNDPSSAAMPQDPTVGEYQRKSTDGFMVGDGMELSLSPSSCSWFSFPLLSPGHVQLRSIEFN